MITSSNNETQQQMNDISQEEVIKINPHNTHWDLIKQAGDYICFKPGDASYGRFESVDGGTLDIYRMPVRHKATGKYFIVDEDGDRTFVIYKSTGTVVETTPKEPDYSKNKNSQEVQQEIINGITNSRELTLKVIAVLIYNNGRAKDKGITRKKIKDWFNILSNGKYGANLSEVGQWMNKNRYRFYDELAIEVYNRKWLHKTRGTNTEVATLPTQV